MEEWKDIPGYEGLYQVSSYGQVRSMARSGTTGKLLKQSVRNGYYSVSLSKDSKWKSHSVHRLVGITFIPNDNCHPIVDHINRNRLDNCITNLRWVNGSQNVLNSEYEKLGKSGHKYISKKCDRWYVTIQRKDCYIFKSLPTLADAISFRDQIISTL